MPHPEEHYTCLQQLSPPFCICIIKIHLDFIEVETPTVLFNFTTNINKINTFRIFLILQTFFQLHTVSFISKVYQKKL